MSSIITLTESIGASSNQIRRKKEGGNTRINVGMGPCGISAGAEEVFQAISDELKDWGIADIWPVAAGCIGLCQWEPIVEITIPGKPKVTYANLTPEKARRVVQEHILEGKVVKEYCLGEGDQPYFLANGTHSI